ncbi:VOC family protein [Dickeya oryzae]|uniref:VOC family protein n=1 Tax=Dickeya oryzae TaxID=1240404 RepID=UPI001AED0C7D|nr:VOC family protein [Dickeya oryzae]MBP2849783.1 VOC family protein [Dickeya oryzae]
MKFSHLGYIVKDSDATIAAMATFFPQITVYRKKVSAQQIYVTFMNTTRQDMQIELVEPLPENRLLSGMLDKERKDCLPYHICFEVDDFNQKYQQLRADGWLALTRPFYAYPQGPLASHLYKPEAGIMEIMSGSTSLIAQGETA